MKARRRRYKHLMHQGAYDGIVENYRDRLKGWVDGTPQHGLFNDDGSRFTGAAMHSAFWKGYDGLTLSGGRLMYGPGSMTRVAYMAGRDMAKGEE